MSQPKSSTAHANGHTRHIIITQGETAAGHVKSCGDEATPHPPHDFWIPLTDENEQLFLCPGSTILGRTRTVEERDWRSLTELRRSINGDLGRGAGRLFISNEVAIVQEEDGVTPSSAARSWVAYDVTTIGASGGGDAQRSD